jgi:hypothetical protein
LPVKNDGSARAGICDTSDILTTMLPPESGAYATMTAYILGISVCIPLMSIPQQIKQTVDRIGKHPYFNVIAQIASILGLALGIWALIATLHSS